MAEFRDLEPSFNVLKGKNISMGVTSNDDVSIADGSAGETSDPAAVDKAAKKIYGWIRKPASKWRSLVALLSGGGLFYVAVVHEISHQANRLHGQTAVVTATQFADWSGLRLCREHAAVVNDLAWIVCDGGCILPIALQLLHCLSLCSFSCLPNECDLT